LAPGGEKTNPFLHVLMSLDGKTRIAVDCDSASRPERQGTVPDATLAIAAACLIRHGVHRDTRSEPTDERFDRFLE